MKKEDMNKFIMGTNSILEKDIKVYYKGIELKGVVSITILPDIIIKELIEEQRE